MGMYFLMLLTAYAVPILLYFAFALPALYFLRQRQVDDVSRAIWALTIVAVPVMGAVAFAAMGPGAERR